MLHGRGHRRAQQARLTPGSFIQRKRRQSEEAALLHPPSRLKSRLSSTLVDRLRPAVTALALPPLMAVNMLE